MTHVNQAAFDLIKQFEGLRLAAYPDPATGGEPITIGFGTTAAAGVGIIPRLGMTITEAQAEGYLRLAVDGLAAHVGAMILRPVTDNQFGACVSLAYNIGLGNFAKSSVLRKINIGDMKGAAGSFALWNRASGREMAGLTRRRAAEAKLFSTP